MNPWWWLESSTDILKGLETLQYKHKVDPPVAVDGTGLFRLDKSVIRDVPLIYCKILPNKSIGESASSGGGAEVKAAKKAAKASAAVNEHADFVRENNMVVECMGRYSYMILCLNYVLLISLFIILSCFLQTRAVCDELFAESARRWWHTGGPHVSQVHTSICEDYKHLRKVPARSCFGFLTHCFHYNNSNMNFIMFLLCSRYPGFSSARRWRRCYWPTRIVCLCER